MKDYEVQLVEHVNYVGFVKATSQEEADRLAAEDTSKVDWARMDGTNHAEIVTGDDYIPTEIH